MEEQFLNPKSSQAERRRRFAVVLVVVLVVIGVVAFNALKNRPVQPLHQNVPRQTLAIGALENLAVKGRAPKTGYSREQFSKGWAPAGGCDVRNRILMRDLKEVKTKSDTDCTVLSGTLDSDPYTGRKISFERGPNSSAVQIDHVVAVSDAWQKGAQQISAEQRLKFYNDPLNLLAVDGPANVQKGDGDAATWLPPNKDYRCRYVARQIAVKVKYFLWITSAERGAIKRVLQSCPDQSLPITNS